MPLPLAKLTMYDSSLEEVLPHTMNVIERYFLADGRKKGQLGQQVLKLYGRNNVTKSTNIYLVLDKEYALSVELKLEAADNGEDLQYEQNFGMVCFLQCSRTRTNSYFAQFGHGGPASQPFEPMPPPTSPPRPRPHPKRKHSATHSDSDSRERQHCRTDEYRQHSEVCPAPFIISVEC